MKKNFKITGALPFFTFLIFSLCLSAVLLAGAGVYKRLNEGWEKSYHQQTAARYISTRVRQREKITVEDFNGAESLCFYETIQGEKFVTKVYFHQGYLWELFCGRSAEMDLTDGEQLFKAKNLESMIQNNVLSVKTEGQTLFFDIKPGRQVG